MILQAEDKPGMIMELNVTMEAPNITMPRNSESEDSVEVDLGSLHLSNAVAWRNGTSIKVPEVRSSSTAYCSLPLFFLWRHCMQIYSSARIFKSLPAHRSTAIDCTDLSSSMGENCVISC